MEYKIKKFDNYNLHLINTDRFKSLNIVLFFTKKFNLDDIKYARMLTHNMVYSSKKYNSKNAISKKGEDLFGARVSSYFDTIGSLEHFVFSCDFLNPKYTDNNYLEDTLDFLYEIIFNPNVHDGEFNKEYFDIIKKDFISANNSIKDNASRFASIEYNKLMYKGTPSEHSLLPSIDDINKVTPKNLYNFYKTLFDGRYNIDVFIYGEYDNSIIDLFNKKFSNLKGGKENLSFSVNHKYKNNVISKEDKLSFNQSRLYVGYRLNDFTKHELLHVMKVYNTILGTMNDSILFNIVREKYSFCYSIGSFYSKVNPSLTIYAGINKDNYEKSVELIKECVLMMSDKNIVSNMFDSAKKTINTYINDYYDDCTSQINKYYFDNYEYIESIEEYRENINNVTIDEVINLNKKISLSCVYFLRGEIND